MLLEVDDDDALWLGKDRPDPRLVAPSLVIDLASRALFAPLPAEQLRIALPRVPPASPARNMEADFHAATEQEIRLLRLWPWPGDSVLRRKGRVDLIRVVLRRHCELVVAVFRGAAWVKYDNEADGLGHIDGVRKGEVALRVWMRCLEHSLFSKIDSLTCRSLQAAEHTDRSLRWVLSRREHHLYLFNQLSKARQ